MHTLNAAVHSITPLTQYVYKVILTPNEPAIFEAGHYLQLVIAEKDKRAFSIASKPSEQQQIELHIGASGEDSYAMQALDHLRQHQQNGTQAKLEVGLGVSQLRPNCTKPIILLAGGTGFSYVKSIAEHLQETQCQQSVVCYWGVKTLDALYAAEQMQAWADSQENFTFIPVIELADATWQGRTGFVHKAVLEDVNNLQDYAIYMAGRFDMMKVVRDDFIANGANPDHMYADAFAFI